VAPHVRGLTRWSLESQALVSMRKSNMLPGTPTCQSIDFGGWHSQLFHH
jgi:hypothetical protein